MKKLSTFLVAISLLCVVGCGGDKYDDSALRNDLTDLANRVAKLEQLCQQMNTNISSLQTIVKALQNNDYVTGVMPITKDGQTIGYTISFTKSQPITIYNGEDGKDGKDGATPVIGVKQDSDNIYYWTLNGEWLLDTSGNKIKAQGTDGKDGVNGENGKDSITPQLKIENDYWYISYDNGASWTQLGKATGEDGQDGANGTNGDSFFQSVDTSNDEYVVFTLSDGTQIQLPTWYAFEQLRTQCNQMNTNIVALQTIVQALQTADYLVSCVPFMENGVQIGYTLTFAKTGSIVIYHGKNGKDGVDGEDGKDGVNGTDATTPVISAKTHTDNILYWTIDGEWLLDDKGNKIPVHGRDGIDGVDGSNGTNGSNGQDGITPQLKIEEGYWYVSYNNGQTWTKLGKAVGENGQDGTNGIDGEDGDEFFQSVTQDEDFIHLILSTGEQIDIPRHHPLSVTFTETEDIRVLANKTYSIGYTITGADDKTVIKALAQDGFRAVVKKTDHATGVIEITTPSTILPTEVLIFVTDGKERTTMRSINFVEGVIIVSSKTFTIGYEGGTVEVPLSTNIDYAVEIPEADKSWISVAETRAVMRDETLTFTVAKNETLAARYTMVKLIDALGVTSETILISQRAGAAQSVHVATAGTLESLVGTSNKGLVEELTVTGNLNFVDFEFIRTMSNLQMLDLSGLSNTTLPASCLAGTTIPTVMLPWNLTAIPNRAFYQSGVTSIYIPETVQAIGEYAFYQCKSIKGNLVIPDATTSIGNYCFQECTFDGTLTLGTELKTIGEYAFSKCTKFTGDLIIPNSVTALGQFAFYQCSGFDGSIVIGNSVETINTYSFFECKGITGSLTLGNNVLSIGRNAFQRCSFTGNLTIPDKCTTIEYRAFCDCTNFSGYLIIGVSVSKIGEGAFVKQESTTEKYYTYGEYLPYTDYYKDLNYSRLYCKAKTPPTLEILSTQILSAGGKYNKEKPIALGTNGVLYIPIGCSETYKSAWGFSNIEEMEF